MEHFSDLTPEQYNKLDTRIDQLGAEAREDDVPL